MTQKIAYWLLVIVALSLLNVYTYQYKQDKYLLGLAKNKHESAICTAIWNNALEAECYNITSSKPHEFPKITQAPLLLNSGTLRFKEHLIKSNYLYAFGVNVGDFDNDGDIDISSSDGGANNLFWFENNGSFNFKQHIILQNDPSRLERHTLADITNNGLLDIIIVKNYNGYIIIIANHGDFEWSKHSIYLGEFEGAYDVDVGDIDGDGDLDIAASTWNGGKSHIYFENNGLLITDKWEKHIIQDNIGTTRAVRLADFDNDGDLDLLGTSTNKNKIVWYENKNNSWFTHYIPSDMSPIHGNPIDFDNDGDMDFVMAFGMAGGEGKVSWFENLGGGRFNENIVDNNFSAGFEAVPEDLDNDGDTDIIATSSGLNGKVYWFENKKEWERHIIKEGWSHANQIQVTDFNNDGLVDIVAVSAGENELIVWENLGVS